MSRRTHAVAVLVATVLVAATCSARFAHAGIAETDACGRAHVWALAKAAAEAGLAVLDGPAIPAGSVELPRQDGPLWLVSRQRDDSCVQYAPAEFLGPRAPPLV